MANAIAEYDVTPFVADITSVTAPGQTLLRELRLNSIPLIVVYGPGTNGRATPQMAHETYTDGQVVRMIEAAATAE